jgi:hypothetical protein
VEGTRMMMITFVGPAMKDRCEGNTKRNLFGKLKQLLRIRQFHNNEEMEVAVLNLFLSGILLENNITSAA